MHIPSTPIARRVLSMLEQGVAHEAIVRAIEAAELKPSRRRGNLDHPARGTRLPADWEIPVTFMHHALARGMPAARIQIEAERFKNYWTAKSGQGAVKRDWFATWRNWVLTAMEGTHAASLSRIDGASPATRRTQTGADAVLAGMGRLAHRLAQGRERAGSDGQVAPDADDSRQPDPESKRT
jgi:hypothetical protein